MGAGEDILLEEGEESCTCLVEAGNTGLDILPLLPDGRRVAAGSPDLVVGSCTRTNHHHHVVHNRPGYSLDCSPDHLCNLDRLRSREVGRQVVAIGLGLQGLRSLGAAEGIDCCSNPSLTLW